MIEVIFSDIDGCFVPRAYDPLGTIQAGDGSEPYFEYYRTYSGPQLVLCTGRAWANTVGILRRAKFLPDQRRAWPDQPVLCEHGIDLITDPIHGKRTALIDELSELADLKPLVEAIRSAGEQLELALDQIREELEGEFGRKVAPLQFLKKDFSVAARIPYFEGTAQQVDSVAFFQSVTRVAQGSLGPLIESGAVHIVPSTSAVDIALPIGKGDGVRYLLEKYGTSPARAAYIGDSTADIDGMKQVHLACCPSNAAAHVKAYVESLGARGYVSPLEFADAEIDILNHIQGRI